MNYKRLIFALLYKEGNFFLSRNFRLQKVGDINWLKNNYSFGETCEYVDEIIILNVKDNPSKQDNCKFITDINEFKKKESNYQARAVSRTAAVERGTS